ncbi:hypothetical protein [Protaetiibacter larvae]|uniref:Uncharacterized protein n=1 Tax=Protaetiibacter larvae TaxID=2592654 RepID=A0A5C1Y556_9MICO|nr:hypothetical protein [Protaetiibacter larvae]QEO08891.1 hypothetical protein FLP23_01950 [Protaetiibacter larvae]
MNRAQLDALLRAGLITAEQHAAALTALTAGTRPALDLHLAVGAVRLEVDTDDSGEQTGVVHADVVTRYDEIIESHGMVIHTGALVPREPLTRNKLMRDHDHTQPVGYMLDVDDARQSASWQVASTEVDRVSQEINDHLRDGLSVGFTIHEYEFDENWVLHIYRADWYETSLCAVPAVQEAGVSSVAAALATARKEHRTMNRAQLAAALAAGQITQEQHDAALAALDTLEGHRPPTVDPAVAAGPQLNEHQAPPPVQVLGETMNVRQVSERLAAAAQSGSLAAVQLAISDILPADDAGTGFVGRENWQGELFTANDPRRPWIDAFGATQELTGIKGKGWRWVDQPDVAEYAGTPSDVPSNDIETESVEFTAFRIAGGWGVDRIFEDLADTEFWSSFWPAATRSYIRQSNAGIRTRTLAAAAAPGAITAGAGGTATVAAGGVLALLKQVIRDVRAIEGGIANRVFLGATQFGLLEDVPTEDLPLWLKSAEIGLDIAAGDANVGRLSIQLDSTLNANQAVAFDSRAAVVREKSPFHLEANAIGKGRIDVGIFSYLRFEPNDPRLIVKRTYGEVLPS